MPRLTRRPPEASKRRPKGGARTTRHAFSHDDEPLIIPHEKQALIRAHADARVKARTGWGIGYYIGVAASCLVVVSGWWLTLDKNIRTNMNPGRDPLVQVLDESTDDLRDNMEQVADGPNGTHAMQASVQRLREEYERARLEAQSQATTTSATTTSLTPSSPSTN